MTADIDWGVHRGSCRVFYAERRCTCGATVASDPMTAAVPDPHFRDQIAQLLLNTSLRSANQPNSGAMALEQADALMPTIAAEVEARVQAAANQRVRAGLALAAQWDREARDEAADGQGARSMLLARVSSALESALADPATNQRVAEVHRAENAEERGEGICRTCLAPIWNEGGTVGGIKGAEGWSDRIERGGDSLVCFKAIGYRHVPLTGREAAIYDRAAALASPAPAPRAEEGQ